MRITITHKVRIAAPAVSTGAAVGAALHPDVLPEIAVAHDHPEHLQCAGVRDAVLPEITGQRDILHLSGRGVGLRSL